MVTNPEVQWHGTQQEGSDLTAAIARNCTCEFGFMGVRLSTCAPHKAMTGDQRFLDGILWERRLRECRLREEFGG